ncbi:MAG: hypothetical protein JW797_00910 [Bradymonadales bacterium]|nr:hypothetical protein [Bradymonadales bacterium]
MVGFLKPFDGFVREDFEVYSPDKWSSNLFNLQRMRVKQKLEGLAALLLPELATWNLGLVHETSPERPSIWNQKKVDAGWLYFFRNEKSQKELQSLLDRERTIAENIDDPAHHHRHIILGVRIDQGGVAMLCGLHRSAWLDRRNLGSRWTIPHERLRLMDYLQTLQDEGFLLQAGDQQQPLKGLGEGRLDTLLAVAATIDGWIGLEHPLVQEEGIALGRELSQTILVLFEKLRPFYEFCAWSKLNDHLSLAKVVTQEKKAKRRSGGSSFDENDVVTIVGGLFSGRTGVVTGFEQGGKVKVRVGTLTLPVAAGSLKLVQRS